jgi:thiol-disulfide isomerase/thioredoxin
LWASLIAVALVGSGCKGCGDEADPTPIQADLGRLDTSNIGAVMKRYQGKVVVVNFWARWCEPCAREMPALAAVAQKHHKAGLVLITVDMTGDDDRRSSRRFLDRYDVRPPRFRYTAKRLEAFTKTLGITWGGNLPATFVFDRQGRLRWSHLGPVTREALEKQLHPLL